MFEMLVTVLLTLLVLAVVVPVTIGWLLVRQVRRTRAYRRLRAARAAAPRVVPRVSAGGEAPLLRPWNRLAAEAVVARDRFVRTVGQAPPGPLRDRLAEVAREVDEAVADAQRLAREGSATQRAQREVATAVAQQRRRSRSLARASADLATDLLASTRAQEASAQRLGEASNHALCQLQLVVARLAELTAHALELTTGASLTHERLAVSSLADHVAALREATADVEVLTAQVAM